MHSGLELTVPSSFDFKLKYLFQVSIFKYLHTSICLDLINLDNTFNLINGKMNKRANLWFNLALFI